MLLLPLFLLQIQLLPLLDLKLRLLSGIDAENIERVSLVEQGPAMPAFSLSVAGAAFINASHFEASSVETPLRLA